MTTAIGGVKLAQCLYCNKKGIFLKVSKDGLCKRCHDPVVLSVQSMTKVINESIELVNNSKVFNTRIGRLETTIDTFRRLDEEYWSKGIRFFKPEPKIAIEKLERQKFELIEDEIKKKIERHLDKSKRAKTIKTKISNADKALDELLKFSQEYDYENKALEDNINTYIKKAQFDDFVENAEKFEFKGNHKKAIDQYQEALFFLRDNELPGVDAIIEEINNKIKVLKE